MSYFSRDKRLARRAERLGDMNKVAESVPTRSASKITTQNAGLQAVTLVRDMFNNYNLPRSPALSYSGIRGARKASDSSKLEDGVVTVYAEFKTPSGVNVGLEVPVEIRHGELLEPSIVVHDGAPRVIAQSTFDDIVSRSCLHEELPVRSMYSAPMEKAQADRMYGNRTKIVTTMPGMFKFESTKRAIRAAVHGTHIKTGASIKIFTMDDLSGEMGPDGNFTSNYQADWTALCEDGKYRNVQISGSNIEMWDNVVYNTAEEAYAAYMLGAERVQLTPQQLADPGLVIDVLDLRDGGILWQASRHAEYDEDGNWIKPWEKKDEGDETKDKKEAAKDHWDTATSERSKELDKDQHPKKPDPDRNEQKLDWLDPAERHEQNDLGPGDETSLKEGLEYRERGGVKWDLPAGKKCTILRDHAGDNKSFVVRFDDGLEAIVERHFLKDAGHKRPDGMKPARPKKPQTQEPWKYKNKFKRNPKKNAQGQVEFNTLRDEVGLQETGTLPEQVQKLFADKEFIAKVNQELSKLHSDGVSEIDAKLAIKSKYGDDVMNAVFEKFGPDDL